MKRYEVLSDVDDNVVFTADSVASEAKRMMISPKKAADMMAYHNADTEYGETLYVSEVLS